MKGALLSLVSVTGFNSVVAAVKGKRPLLGGLSLNLC
jgi:hypothetical protein